MPLRAYVAARPTGTGSDVNSNDILARVTYADKTTPTPNSAARRPTQ